ncbi:homoserine dehydrogenase [Saccharopolyspora taberi]|uniref:homoserine dehydrogenase n=1 Tax=Saccharopolyspora taberi TaxID=60895 RepID=A0ABN3VJG3_9PSEU
MEPIPVLLAGWGPVGREYAGLLRAAGERFGLDFQLVEVRGHRTRAAVRGGKVPARDEWEPIDDLSAALSRTGARVFAQAVPSDGDDRAGAEALTALGSGAHVVTATKSHLLTRWNELAGTAEATGAAIRISAATGAAMPAGDLARSALRGFDVRSVRGCLNGTATFVLDRLAAGEPLADAVAEAQRLGIAEADVSADLSGRDAATKMRLLAALLWGWDPAATEVRAEPVAARPVEAGHRLRQVAAADAARPGIVEVGLVAEPADSPLGALTGPEKAVRYDCGDAGPVTVSGGRSSPRGAALAMVKDTLGAVLEGTAGFR